MAVQVFLKGGAVQLPEEFIESFFLFIFRNNRFSGHVRFCYIGRLGHAFFGGGDAIGLVADDALLCFAKIFFPLTYMFNHVLRKRISGKP